MTVAVAVLLIPLAIVLAGVFLFLKDVGVGIVLGLWLGWCMRAPRPLSARRVQLPDPQLRLWPE